MLSPQTLEPADRRAVAGWAADCAEHVLPIFEGAAPNDRRPHDLIARTRAFARGDTDTASGIRRRLEGGVPAGDVRDPAAYAAARSAGQAVAVSHMGAHAFGAAGYAARAAGLAAPDRTDGAIDEIRWQLDHLSPEARAALRLLPKLGENTAGPLGPGLLSSGPLGEIIGELQDRLTR